MVLFSVKKYYLQIAFIICLTHQDRPLQCLKSGKTRVRTTQIYTAFEFQLFYGFHFSCDVYVTCEHNGFKELSV